MYVTLNFFDAEFVALSIIMKKLQIPFFLEHVFLHKGEERALLLLLL